MRRTKLWAERGNMAYSQGKSLTGVGNTHMTISQLGGLVTDTGMRMLGCEYRYKSTYLSRYYQVCRDDSRGEKGFISAPKKVREFTSTDAADIQHWVASLLMRRSFPQLTHCRRR
jgi:hypothetical protein